MNGSDRPLFISSHQSMHLKKQCISTCMYTYSRSWGMAYTYNQLLRSASCAGTQHTQQIYCSGQRSAAGGGHAQPQRIKCIQSQPKVKAEPTAHNNCTNTHMPWRFIATPLLFQPQDTIRGPTDKGALSHSVHSVMHARSQHHPTPSASACTHT
jgi:hypothetical protein